MLEGKAVNASQAFNHCKHIVRICKEAMARNHSLRSCKPPVCNWKQSVDSREWQVLIPVDLNTKRECCYYGSSFLFNDWMGNQRKWLLWLDGLVEIHNPLSDNLWSLVLCILKGKVTAYVLNGSSLVCSPCYVKQIPSWEVQAVKKDIA